MNATAEAGSALLWAVGAAGPQVKKNARYFGLNLLSELDAPGEYFVSRENDLLYYQPAVSMDKWAAADVPVLSVNATAVTLDGTRHIVLSGVAVAHATSTGPDQLSCPWSHLESPALFLHSILYVQKY